jgi:hypothetical protein
MTYRLPSLILMELKSAVTGIVRGWVRDTLNSLRYCISVRNGWKILWGGVMVLLSTIVIGFPLLFGYLTRCLKAMLSGDMELPGFEDRRKMFVEGLKVSVLAGEYLLLTLIFFSILFNIQAVSVVSNSMDKGMDYLTRTNVLIPVLVQGMAFGVLFGNAWLRYILHGSLRSAMNPLKTILWMAENPQMILNNAFSTGLAGLLLLIPGFLLVTAPWVTFIGFSSNAYIRVKTYHDMVSAGALKEV